MKQKIGLGCLVLFIVLLCACSSSEDAATTGWLTAEELEYQGITVGQTTLEDLQGTLEYTDDYTAIETPDGISYYLYAEDNTEYYSAAQEPYQIVQIIIRDPHAQPIAKGIKIGDSLNDILQLLPKEPQTFTYTEGEDPEESIYPAANKILLFVRTDNDGKIISQTMSICTENTFPLVMLNFNESAIIDSIQIMSQNN